MSWEVFNRVQMTMPFSSHKILVCDQFCHPQTGEPDLALYVDSNVMLRADVPFDTEVLSLASAFDPTAAGMTAPCNVCCAGLGPPLRAMFMAIAASRFPDSRGAAAKL